MHLVSVIPLGSSDEARSFVPTLVGSAVATHGLGIMRQCVSQ